jgi:2-polyprenyl-3-methyl-5-hydroxy-6-metoxy-1,4-benzoquinol methylase
MSDLMNESKKKGIIPVNYYFPFRYQNHIEKQMLWFLLGIILYEKKYDQVLDIGCGMSPNIRYIKYKNYTGTDIQENIIDMHRSAISPQISFTTQDITKEDCPSFSKRYDLILFVQVLKNALFDQQKIDIALHNIIKMSKGKIIFNTMGNPNIETIDNVLITNNIKFKKIYFGLPKMIMKIKIPIVSQILALIFLPLILVKNILYDLTEEIPLHSKNNILYICETL